MVKLIGALFSNIARGKFGAIVYQTGNFGQIATTFTPQRKKPTQAQKDLNYAFGATADNWRNLTAEQKQVWIDNAKGMRMTGYNLYIKENIIIP